MTRLMGISGSTIDKSKANTSLPLPYPPVMLIAQSHEVAVLTYCAVMGQQRLLWQY